MVLDYDYDELGGSLSACASVCGTASGWVPDDDDGWPAPPAEPLGEDSRRERYEPAAIRRPLVLVGGYAANGLALADRSNSRCYLSRQIWPPFHFHPGTGDWSLHGVSELNQPGLIPTGLVIGQYEPLLLFLQQELGYRWGVDLFHFPYRWTESIEESGRRLAGFVERLGVEVDVIGHSMGGLVARTAGLLYNAPLQRSAYLACPFFGAGKGYLNLHPQHGVHLVDNLLLNRLLALLAPQGNGLAGTGNGLVECFQRMPSLFELLPDRLAFERGLSPVGLRKRPGSHPVALESWQRAYLDEPTTAFPGPLHDEVCRAMAFKEKLGLAMPGKSFLTLYSDCHPTVGRVDLAFEISGYAVFGNPYDAAGGGDGTVPAASGRGPGPAIVVHGRHLALPNHRLTFYWLARFLANA